MEVAANITTFVLVGLKSAKAIKEIISGIKDGPGNVRRTAAAVGGLVSTLLLLSECRALDERGSKALEERLLACVDDLEDFDKHLREFTIEESETRRGRYWKRIKAFLSEKRLEQFCDIVTQHTTALDLQLGVLQRFSSLIPQF